MDLSSNDVGEQRSCYGRAKINSQVVMCYMASLALISVLWPSLEHFSEEFRECWSQCFQMKMWREMGSESKGNGL